MSHYKQLYDNQIDEIDAAIWSGDTFHNRENIAAFRDIMARWERGLQEAESILDQIESD
jgi:hypothetical protein